MAEVGDAKTGSTGESRGARDARDVRTALVLGSGVMGASIAQVIAGAGIEVRLVDVRQTALDRAMGLIKSGLLTFVEFGRIRRESVPAILARIVPSTDLVSAAAGADFVIEAVSEDAGIKRSVLLALDTACPADVAIASNTSSLDIFGLADFAGAERLVIAHFFAPAHIIPLVEVVPGPRTAPEVVGMTKDLMERVGKSPIVLARFVPSFIVNRIQQAIGRAVEEILENGWAGPEEIDRAVKLSLGVRLPIVGVVQTIDFTGLDVVRDILVSIGRDTSFFDERVKEGHLGVKTGRGMYDYEGRSEVEILKKRDLRFLQMIERLKEIHAFEPV
jgi:3-hydroxybutyryl-CoA dehydrogenase